MRKKARRLGEVPEIALSRAGHGVLHAAGAAVIRRQRQVPIAAEHAAERFQIRGRGARGLFRICALVDVPVLLQPVLEGGASHELPHALGLGTRLGVRIEGALDDGDVRQVERKPLRAKHLLDHRQVSRAAAEALVEPVVQPGLKQLDVGKNFAVERNIDIVLRQLKVGFDGVL